MSAPAQQKTETVKPRRGEELKQVTTLLWSHYAWDDARLRDFDLTRVIPGARWVHSFFYNEVVCHGTECEVEVVKMFRLPSGNWIVYHAYGEGDDLTVDDLHHHYRTPSVFLNRCLSWHSHDEFVTQKRFHAYVNFRNGTAPLNQVVECFRALYPDPREAHHELSQYLASRWFSLPTISDTL